MHIFNQLIKQTNKQGMHDMAISSLYRSTAAAALLTAMAAAGQAQAAVPASYVLSELAPLPGGTQASVAGIDNLGQIVGNSDYGLGGAVHATLWANGVATDLGTLGGVGSSATAISNSGQVLGWAYTAGPNGGDGDIHQVSWDAMSPRTPPTDLGPEGFGFVNVKALNSAGQMVGTQSTDTAQNVVLISQGISTVLGTLGGPSATALGINDHGDVVGASQRAAGGQMQATLWRGQTAIDLGATGANGSRAMAINDAGQIIGSVVDELWHMSAVTWVNGQLTLQGDLAGTGFARANGINNAGLIVGMSQTKDFVSRAVMWDGTQAVDLNGLLDDAARAAGWDLVDAVGVNDGGTIVGLGLQNNVPMSFVLTPVPEASRYAMTVTGLLLLGGLLWRRKTMTR
jgi:probable HAF family extracellular repeat protein